MKPAHSQGKQQGIEDVGTPTLVEMKISFFRPARVGATITGTGRIVKGGRRLFFAEVEVTDEDGKLLAKASGTEIPSEVTKR